MSDEAGTAANSETEATPAASASAPPEKPRSGARWTAIISMLVILLGSGGAFGYVYLHKRAETARAAELAAFTPSEANRDPSAGIAGIVVKPVGASHVQPGDRVAYTSSPPFGGAHDPYWAACTGVVYERPVRTENLVHALEHGAAWIAYNPDQVTGQARAELDGRIRGKPYSLMAPYPGLDRPISLQTWGHQLKLDDARDPRIDQFLTALHDNPYTHPELNAPCQALGPGMFDQDNPPPFQPVPPVSAIGQPGIQSETPPPGTPGTKASPHG